MSTEKKFVVKHHLDQLSTDELAQYLREVSTFIGLDPDLNGLDTIWLDNESGVGRTLVPYAKRGTAEILRNVYEIDVEELSHSMVGGSIVFTAAGRSTVRKRRERATGSKYISGLTGKALDNSIMTASTRALRRLTMQFTTLGILDESEVVDIIGQNPASSAQLSGSSIVIPPQPQVPANNQPGKEVITLTPAIIEAAKVMGTTAEALAIQLNSPDKKADTKEALVPSTPTESVPSVDIEPDKKADKKTRKKKNTVSLEVEPEVVQSPKPAEIPIQKYNDSVNDPAHLVVPPSSPSVPPPPQPAPPQPQTTTSATSAVGLPSPEQMIEYRKKVSVFTQQLPATPGLGSVQRMRAFITRMSDGIAPQDMNVVQWEKLLAWFDNFVGRNGVKGLITYIGDILGDVPKKA